MTTILQDLRYALRVLAKSPSFTIIAIVTLALGIGANTSLFSVVNGVLLNPLPFPHPEQLVTLHASKPNFPTGSISYPNFRDWQKENSVFAAMAISRGFDYNYSGNGPAEQIRGSLISSDYFSILGVKPVIGRLFVAGEDEPNAAAIVLLDGGFWSRKFGSSPSVLGKSITLDGRDYRIVGVIPASLGQQMANARGIRTADVYVPVGQWAHTNPFLLKRSAGLAFHGIARLKPSVTLAQAQADMDSVTRALAAEYPEDDKDVGASMIPLRTDMLGRIEPFLLTLLGAVGFVLLIACANVANLLLARATTREKEFAIRAALGAGRWRLVRQLLVESMILALGGAAFGALLAWGGLKSLIAIIPQNIIPAEATIRLNATVLIFTLVVSVLTALVFGLVPALQAARRDLNDPLRDSGKGVAGGFRHGRLRDAVVVLEVAVSLTLLVGAGLLMRSFVALHEVKLGLQPDHILVARLPLPRDRYKTADQVASFYRPLLERLKALPGVLEATETSTLPPYGGIPSDIEVLGKSHSETWNSAFQLCSEGYFPVLKIQFVMGRPFTEAEVSGARKVMVVNQTFAHKFLGGDNPLGQRVHLLQLENGDPPVHDAWFEIIGVVADVKNRGLQEPVTPEAWVPYTMTGRFERGILVRTASEPLAMLNAVRQEIWKTDRGVALTLTGTLEGYISQFSYAGPRFGFFLLGIFASVGLILVTIGVYSLLAYTAARRTHEIGIRMALGATGSHVLGLVIRMGLRLVLLGIGIGLAVSLSVAKVLAKATELWGVSPYDARTMVAVPVLLLITGLVACWVPARRAARVDPLIALRYE